MRRIVGVLTILLGFAVGCGSDGADVEVTYDAAYLAQVADTTSAISSYRLETTFETYMAMNGHVLVDTRESEANISTFVDGRASVRLDIGAAMGTPGAATMELVNDEASLFMRFDSSLDIDPTAVGPGGFLWEQPGTWMFADMAQLLERIDGTKAADVWRAAGAGSGLDAWLDMLRSSGNVTEEGSTELGGDPVTHLAVAASLRDLYAAQGVDADALLGSVVPGVDIGNATTRVDLYVDADDVLRRMEMTMTEENLAGLSDQPMGSFDFLMHTVQDVTRVGDPDLSVELPDRDGARDVTDDYGDLMAASVLR